MNKITVIIPVHRIANENDLQFFNNMKESINQQHSKAFNVLIITPDVMECNADGFSYDFSPDVNVKIHYTETALSYQNAVNLGASLCETPYFTVLEFDDVFTNKYIYHANRHLKVFKDSYDVLLNLVFEVNESGGMMGIRNEVAWVVNQMNVQGELDIDKSKQMLNSLSLVGAIINKERFLSINGLKPSFEMFFNQEFIIRALENSFNIFVIPRIGVKHTNNRAGSYFDECSKTFSNEDRRYWHSQILMQSYTNEDYKKPQS